jgi:hypothetical protein
MIYNLEWTEEETEEDVEMPLLSEERKSAIHSVSQWRR